jgi:hypothetical protein
MVRGVKKLDFKFIWTMAAYNFAKRLKTLSGLTPHEYVCKIWTEDPGRFKKDPTHLTAGLYT